MSVYYNENDAYAASWLRNLIAAGHLPAGDVDERSIVDVQADDLRGYVQCHFFAGIGGWPLALRLAGWPDDRPVWSGSCPCQPFSNAGARQGEKDKRHLWPDFLRLISEWDVPTIFGEQVASGLGREWLARVRTDLEELGYVVGAADLCAASCGAPHIRQRLYWVADDDEQGCSVVAQRDGRPIAGSEVQQWPDPDGRGDVHRMADTDEGECRRLANGEGCERDGASTRWQQSDSELERSGDISGLANTTSRRRIERNGSDGQPERARDRSADADGLGDDDDARLALGSIKDDGHGVVRLERSTAGTPSSLGAWSRYVVVNCSDGKARRFEPGSFPLAYGVSSRVGRLRAYGNAIVPQVAARFILASRECIASRKCARGRSKRKKQEELNLTTTTEVKSWQTTCSCLRVRVFRQRIWPSTSRLWRRCRHRLR